MANRIVRPQFSHKPHVHGSGMGITIPHNTGDNKSEKDIQNIQDDTSAETIQQDTAAEHTDSNTDDNTRILLQRIHHTADNASVTRVCIVLPGIISQERRTHEHAQMGHSGQTRGRRLASARYIPQRAKSSRAEQDGTEDRRTREN